MPAPHGNPGGNRIAALLATVLLASACGPGWAQVKSWQSGSWVGEYQCAQGVTGLALTIGPAQDGKRQALFHFHAVAANPDVPEGCYSMRGAIAGDGAASFTGEAWLLRPENYVMVDLVGRLDGAGFAGTVLPHDLGCSVFQLHAGPDPWPLPRSCRNGLPETGSIT